MKKNYLIILIGAVMTALIGPVMALGAVAVVAIVLIMNEKKNIDVVIIYASIIATIIVVFVQFGWGGVVKTLDKIAGNGNGYTLIPLLPFVVALMAYMYVALGELTLSACKKIRR